MREQSAESREQEAIRRLRTFRTSFLTLCLLLSALCALLSTSASARPVDADLDVRSVDIGHDFNGQDILLYGARGDIGRIVVVLRGPDHHYLVRKKERVGGIWMNRKNVEFAEVPSFYAAAATGTAESIRNDHLLSTLDIGLEHIATPEAEGGHHGEGTLLEFRGALMNHLAREKLYRPDMGEVSFMGETLFRTWLGFPKNILGGTYTAEVFLFNDGQLTSVQTIPIRVSKTGFEAFVAELAHRQRILYGFLCVLMALSAGWAGSRVFKR